MENQVLNPKHFKKINNIIGWVVFAIAAITYLLTLEPTVSFWDCGEFIASSYKLEVGHPPGNPTFQIIARIFTLFADPSHAAVMVNAMSGLCAAFTILFLFWSISHLGRRLLEKRNIPLTKGAAIGVWGAAAVGALVYTWSDTFWFSAVEAEVYAMSSLFTALVFWAMLKWEECADKPYANRWIVLIAYLMGLSIGVHLLNLLTIPAIVFIYYYKKYPFSWKSAILTFGLSAVLIAFILFGIIPWLLKISSVFDLFFVNTLHLPFNTGMLFFVLVLLALLLWGIIRSYKKSKVLWNTILLCVFVIITGYTSFAMVVIRSSAMTPTNENQPDNPFALERYLGREQYGKAPLLFGGSYNVEPTGITETSFHTKFGDKYIKAPTLGEYTFADGDEMLFPRMHSRGDNASSFYDQYLTNPKRKPSLVENLTFFFDYQVNYMYWRYFMWNFAGRQNDLHGTNPGDPMRGNWESGITFIDRLHLADERLAPASLAENKARNHFYFLPLLLGIIGLFYQLMHDKRNAWITFLLFFLTGLAIVVYLNQPPYQPRERDYAYAGSFYAFAVWVGLGVMALQDFFRNNVKLKEGVASTLAAILCICVPLQMVSQTWDDHDRSNRYTARDMAENYLESCLPGSILITHGDNDTFPLWYSQEVEGVRTDVRIMNTSLMGVDWYIDQMQYRFYESAPIKFTIPKEIYIYGSNDMVPILDRVDKRVMLSQAVGIMANPSAKYRTSEGDLYTYLPARKLRVNVNKENALASGIVSPDKADLIPDYIDIDVPAGKNYLSKYEMMFLDMLSTYQWDRPIYVVNRQTDLNIGITDYMQKDGLVNRLVPYKVAIDNDHLEIMDLDSQFEKFMNYKWDSLKDTTIYCDYQNIYTFAVVTQMRSLYSEVANNLALAGRTDDMLAILDKCIDIMPTRNFPYCFAAVPSYNELAILEIIELYYYGKATEKARDLANNYLLEIVDYATYLLQPYRGSYMAQREGESCLSCFYQVLATMRDYGDNDIADKWESVMDQYTGKSN